MVSWFHYHGLWSTETTLHHSDLDGDFPLHAAIVPTEGLSVFLLYQGSGLQRPSRGSLTSSIHRLQFLLCLFLINIIFLYQELYQMYLERLKMLDIISPQGNSNLNRNEIPLHTHQRLTCAEVLVPNVVMSRG